MEEQVDFDEFSQDYNEVLNKSIALSGEDSDFFLDLKMKLLQHYFKKSAQRRVDILDYGCGTGRAAAVIAKYFPQSKYVGIDPSEKSITVARKNYPEQSFHVLNGALNLGERTFDIVFAAVVFHHIQRGQQVTTLQQIYQSLKPGGYFVLFEHNPYNPLTVRIVKNCPFDKDAVLLQPGYAKKLLKKANFKTRWLQYYFFFPKFLSFLRPCETLLAELPLGAQYMLVGRKPKK